MNTSPLVSDLLYRRGSSGVVTGSHRHLSTSSDVAWLARKLPGWGEPPASEEEVAQETGSPGNPPAVAKV